LTVFIFATLALQGLIGELQARDLGDAKAHLRTKASTAEREITISTENPSDPDGWEYMKVPKGVYAPAVEVEVDPAAKAKIADEAKVKANTVDVTNPLASPEVMERMDKLTNEKYVIDAETKGDEEVMQDLADKF
jgi:hypothetical protein